MINRSALHPDAQWFDPLGRCVGCGKAATGTLMGKRNDRRGSYCARCAEEAIKLRQRRENIEFQQRTIK